MKPNFIGKNAKEHKIGIVIISGACCIPGMASLDEQAQKIVKQAVSETGVEVEIKMMPATSAYFSGALKEVIAKLTNDFNKKGGIGLPAILINGKVVSYGVPSPKNIKSALLEIKNKNSGMDE